MATAIVYGIYFIKFGGEGCCDQSKFGAFGDYVGGVLNPLLSAITVILLVLSFRVQSDQLRQAKEAHEVESKIATQERQRHQLEEFARHYLVRIDELLERKVFTNVYLTAIAGGARSNSYSIRDLAMYGSSSAPPNISGFLQQISDPETHRPNPAVQDCLQQLRESYLVLFEVICDLMPLVAAPVIRVAWRDQYQKAIGVARTVELIDAEVYSQRMSLLTLAVGDPAITHQRQELFAKPDCE